MRMVSPVAGPRRAGAYDDLAEGAGCWPRAIFWSIINVVVVFRCISAKQDYCYKFGEG